MWTKELVERLEKYVRANRYFEVTYRNQKVYGIDLAPDPYPFDQAAIYLQEGRPDSFLIPAKTKPEDFVVQLLTPVPWQKQEPQAVIDDQTHE